MKHNSQQIELIMNKLDCSYQEAIDILKSDVEIDKGVKLFELDPNQKRVEKKMRQADSEKHKTAHRVPPNRKIDEMKKCILAQVVKVLEPNCDTAPIIVNPEREFTFFYNGKKYKITLSCPRS